MNSNSIVETLNRWGIHFTDFALPALVQSSLLIALLLLLDFGLRKRLRASVRYALWLLLLVKLVLPPSLASPTSVAYWLRGWRAQPIPTMATPAPDVSRVQPAAVEPP